MSDWSSKIWEAVNGQLHNIDALPYSINTSHKHYSYDKNKYNRKDFYTVYKDNHNLTIMDYCLYINKIGGPLSWRRDGDEFYLNPDAKRNNPDAHNTLHSVEIELVPTVNQRTAGSRFCRESRRKDFQHQPYTGHLDTLGDFMVLVHNTFYTNDKNSPVQGKIMIKGQHGTALSKGMKQASKLRQVFIDGYIRMFHTNKSLINYHNLADIGNSQHQNNIDNYLSSSDYYKSDKSKGARLTSGKFVDAYKGKQDKRYKFPTYTKPFKKMAAYKYLCVTRGIPALELRTLMQHDLVRSYNSRRYFHFKVSSKMVASLNLQYKAIGGFYNRKNHEYYRPNVMPTPGHTFKELESNSGDFSLKIDKQTKDITDEKQNFQVIDLANPKATGYIKDPYLRLKYALQAGLVKWTNSAYPRVMFNWKLPQTKEQFTTLQASQTDEKVVGQDVIYLKQDCYHKEPRKFSNGKQIRPHPKKNYGYNVKHGSGKGTLYVFEAPVDALSFIALHAEDLRDKDFTVLSLGGAGKTKAIDGYMEAQHAQKGDYPNVIICFDDDHGGFSSINGLTAKYANKGQYVKLPVKPLNSITRSPQNISVMVPGIARFRTNSRNYFMDLPKSINFHKEVPHDAPVEWKDYNDVLQGICNSKYLSHRPTLRNHIISCPDAHMNIAQYGQYQMNMTMDSAIGKNGHYQNADNIADFFASYYALDKSIHQHNMDLKHLNPHNMFIAQMRSHYGMLTGDGKKALHRLMDTNSSQHCWGGQSISPHDLYMYSNIYQHYHGKALGKLGIAKGFTELAQTNLFKNVVSNLKVAKFDNIRAKALYIWALRSFIPYLTILQRGYAKNGLDKENYKGSLMMTRDILQSSKRVSGDAYAFVSHQLGELSTLSLSYKKINLAKLDSIVRKISGPRSKYVKTLNTDLSNSTKMQLHKIGQLRTKAKYHGKNPIQQFKNTRFTMNHTDTNHNGSLADTNKLNRATMHKKLHNQTKVHHKMHRDGISLADK